LKVGEKKRKGKGFDVNLENNKKWRAENDAEKVGW
jgi:hypothetical protein